MGTEKNYNTLPISIFPENSIRFSQRNVYKFFKK